MNQKAVPDGSQGSKGFVHFLTLLIVVSIAIFVGVFILVNFKNGHLQNNSNLNLPSCPKDYEGILTSPLTENDKITSIAPLGNLNPGGGHLLLTDHMYVGLKKEGNLTVRTKLYSPGDLTIETINESKTYDPSGALISSGYDINFSPCREIIFGLGDVKEISETLHKLTESAEKNCHIGEKEKGFKNQSCTYRLNYQAKAGELIGWVGGDEFFGFDLGAYDNRVTHQFINPKRYNEYHLHSICPLDLYSGKEKKVLYSKLQDHDGKRRVIEPLCGTNFEDELGTISGGWFIGEVEPLNEFSGKVLSIVHDNFDPSKAVIAVGGTIIPQAGQMTFTPKHEGVINREPKEIKDSNIYCFQNEFPDYGTGVKLTGKILVQLADVKTLKVEYQDGTCNLNVNFDSPTIYQR